MAGFGIRVEGLEENIQALQQIGQELPAELPDEVTTATFPIYYALANYDAPSVPTYTRTYAMRDSIYAITESTGSGASVAIGGNKEVPLTRGTPDGSYPGAWMHVGRWRTFKDIVDTLMPVATFKIEQAIDALVKRIWGNS